MESMQLNIKGTVIGENEIRAMLNAAPEVYTRYFRRFFNSVGSYFIGNAKGKGPKKGAFTGKGSRAKLRDWKDRFQTRAKNGIIRAELAAKKNKLGNLWSNKFINAAMNYRVNYTNSLDMTMTAGTLYTKKKRVHELMEFLESGGTFTSNKYMVTPIYGNFVRKLDQFKGYKGILNKLVKDGKVSIVNKNGNIYYVDKATDKILAVGSKSLSVGKKYEFYGKWAEVVPQIKSEMMVLVENACRDIMELNSNG